MNDDEKRAIKECEISLEIFRTIGNNVLLKAKDLKILLKLIEKHENQIQTIYEEFNKYDWDNSTEIQTKNQVKSLYNAIKGGF